MGLLFRSKLHLIKNDSYHYITVAFIRTYLTLTQLEGVPIYDT